MAEVTDLTYAECRAVLAAAPVGRVAVCTQDGPHIVPVNYVVLDESVVFRTSPDSLLASHVRDQAIAFEVDHVDDARYTGWSVLARGRAHPLQDPPAVERVQRLARLSPWAGGARELYVQLSWRTLTGRKLRA